MVRDGAAPAVNAIRRRRRRGAAAFVILAGLLALAAGIAAVLAIVRPDAFGGWVRGASPSAQSDRAIRQLGLDTEIMPLTRAEAVRLNALRPADVVELTAARPFAIADRFRTDARFGSALDCLTQAIYYEAASESDSGQRAVAQVVLNRVAHYAFPSTVCGVVYQGSELPTGCQFTFTCDGSLSRPPSEWGWARARKVALAGLSGWVEPGIGMATHYHASYVVPYWASSLDKVKAIGLHIFYAMRGGAGAPSSFSARYDFAGEFVRAPLAASGLASAPPVFEPTYDDVAADAAPVAVPAIRADHTPLGEPVSGAGSLRGAASSGVLADERGGELIVGQSDAKLIGD